MHAMWRGGGREGRQSCVYVGERRFSAIRDVCQCRERCSYLFDTSLFVDAHNLHEGHVDVDGAEVVVEPCTKAIAAGDGRELWQYLSNGQITSVLGKKCIGLRKNEAEKNSAVILTSCDQPSAAGGGPSRWEAQGSGKQCR